MSIIQGHAKSSGVTAFYPKTIDQSLRFEDGDSAYLSRTPASASNRKTFTWSGWVKRGNLGLNTVFFSTAESGTSNPRSSWRFTSDTLYIGFNATGGAWRELVTTPVYRDTSAWYHIVVAVDTTQATSSDRVKLYVNGEQVTTFGTEVYPPQNTDLTFNNTVAHAIGRYEAGDSEYFDGYLAEVHFTDGTAYTADDFGELKSGIWVPKSPSVTYGTNGFYLDFADGAAIGDDESGNGNDWTVNNLVASDVVLDSPTNNFATINAVDLNGNRTLTYSQGNLRVRVGGSSDTRSTFGADAGKWYTEVYFAQTESGNAGMLGVQRMNTPRGDSSRILYYGPTGNQFPDNTAYGSTYGVTDVIGIALDMDNGAVWFHKNGTWQGGASLAEIEAGTTTNAAGTGLTGLYGIVFSTGSSGGAQHYIANFGQDSTFAGTVSAGGNSDANGIGDFKYAPPSGYLALCTSNLPDPVIDPAQDATPEDHFNVALWTGNGSTQSIDVGHASDFVWIKTRNAVVDHRNYDSVRGVNTALRSNTSGAEAVETTSLTSFDSTGFSLGNYAGVNNSGSTYVGWSWKAGGTGVSNTDGTITSTVSANTDAGFSIVGYTGNGTAGATVGHGLSSAPEMIIVKERTGSGGETAANWFVYHHEMSSDPKTDFLKLNSNDAVADNTYWDDTAPTDSVFTVGDIDDINGDTQTYISYSFHSVDGFSKVGSYTGNGSTDGVFVYTGFKPKWIMVKRSDSGVATADWYIWDAERNTFNVAGKTVQANESTAESDSGNHDLDILSNGFKLRIDYSTVNGSGNNFIYLAFAEQPFKYSNAR